MQFLNDVSRAKMQGPVSAEWQLNNVRNISPFGDDVRLRFTLLDPLCDVALAKSRPPQNIPENPEEIHYFLARKQTGEDEEFVYTAVIEPYLRNKRRIATLRKLPLSSAGAANAAVEVVLQDGRRDVIVQCVDDSATAEAGGTIRFRGRLLIARFDTKGNLDEMLAVRPQYVKIGDVFEQTYAPCARGTVAAYDKGASGTCTITLEETVAVPGDALRPLWTDIAPSPAANGNYRIESIIARDGRTILNLGDVSLISDFDVEQQEYTHAFEEGATSPCGDQTSEE